MQLFVVRPTNIVAATLIPLIVVATAMPALARSQVENKTTRRAQDFGDETKKPFAMGASYSVCFTPRQNCEALIVDEVRHAQSSILVQAYLFTSSPIAKALADAKQRGVDVRAILDKSQRSERYTGATFLKHAGIPVVIDEQPAIAHSKIMIFDQKAVLTGSFNFTRAAQERNAENLIVIRGDESVVRAYLENWGARWSVSVPY